VLFAFCYFILRALLRIGTDDARGREAEILVLRHQLAVLKRSNSRPRLRRRDRMVIAALANLIDRDRWSGFIVSPATILRWHRELVRCKWTFGHRKAGRPPLDPALVRLIVQMARENPRWGVIRIKGELQGARAPGGRDHDPHDPPPRRHRAGSPARRAELVGVPAVPGSGDLGL
jgi:hypothetical protein